MHFVKALKHTASLPSRKVATNHTPTNNKNNHDGQHLHSPYNMCLALLQALYIYQTKSSVFLTGPWERHCWSHCMYRKPRAQESMFPHTFVNTGYYLVFLILVAKSGNSIVSGIFYMKQFNISNNFLDSVSFFILYKKRSLRKFAGQTQSYTSSQWYSLDLNRVLSGSRVHILSSDIRLPLQLQTGIFGNLVLALSKTF